MGEYYLEKLESRGKYKESEKYGKYDVHGMGKRLLRWEKEKRGVSLVVQS